MEWFVVVFSAVTVAEKMSFYKRLDIIIFLFSARSHMNGVTSLKLKYRNL